MVSRYKDLTAGEMCNKAVKADIGHGAHIRCDTLDLCDRDRMCNKNLKSKERV
jgi:uncharacterized protein (DUF1786 family)